MNTQTESKNESVSKTTTNKQTVHRFIEEVWNHEHFDVLDELLHPDYRDHSFLPSVPPTKEGLKFWIQNTSIAFNHRTHIESFVAEGDQVAVRIRFDVTHVGTWRGIEATGKQANIKGFRFFTFKDGKIATQHALIDGEALQTELTQVYKGCELVK
jgi:predicted SnoaL-like aldol condensation-catalyzing enzyme